MRFMKWVSIMWAIVFFPAYGLFHVAAGIKPGPDTAIANAIVVLILGGTVLVLLALAPAIVLGWIGLMVWRLTGSRKEPPHIEVIQPIRPPAEPPPGADAGHRWLG